MKAKTSYGFKKIIDHFTMTRLATTMYIGSD